MLSGMSSMDTIINPSGFFPLQWKWQLDSRGPGGKRSIVAVHNSLYMKEVNQQVCSAAFIICYTCTRCRAKGAVVEWSESADNYRAEILSAISAQLVLREASRDSALAYAYMVVDCDNKGVVLHGNSACRSLKEKKSQVDM